jgi:hypothetical protein
MLECWMELERERRERYREDIFYYFIRIRKGVFILRILECLSAKLDLVFFGCDLCFIRISLS